MFLLPSMENLFMGAIWVNSWLKCYLKEIRETTFLYKSLIQHFTLRITFWFLLYYLPFALWIFYFHSVFTYTYLSKRRAIWCMIIGWGLTLYCTTYIVAFTSYRKQTNFPMEFFPLFSFSALYFLYCIATNVQKLSCLLYSYKTEINENVGTWKKAHNYETEWMTVWEKLYTIVDLMMVDHEDHHPYFEYAGRYVGR